MAHGASEEFLKGKLEQLSQDLKKNAQSLDQETRRIKGFDPEKVPGDWKASWDAFAPKLQKQIDMVNELEKKLHEYRNVSKEVQIADKAQKLQKDNKMAYIDKELVDLQSKQRILLLAFWSLFMFGAGCVLQRSMVIAVPAIRGRVAFLCQLVRETCGLPEAAPNTRPLLDHSVEEQQLPPNGASDASVSSHSDSGIDSDSRWHRIPESQSRTSSEILCNLKWNTDPGDGAMILYSCTFPNCQQRFGDCEGILRHPWVFPSMSPWNITLPYIPTSTIGHAIVWVPDVMYYLTMGPQGLGIPT